ncbi:BnaA10g11320D [Brassica napus]|uniref:(rape) hypothetical protein n=1 Tax=Brassica napus TaxID=3708 RepID=A0A078HLP7_BRANA|nr:unnamed protein product [Brassica napus]CDY38284.1 BnaA10g11320D [Brassica napus]
MKLHHRPSFSLQSLLKSGFSPTLTSIETFLRYLHRRHKLTTILLLYSQLASNKLLINPTIHSLVSSSLLNLNRYEDAANFITTQISKSSLFPTTRTLDSLIRGFTDPDKALSILSDCLRNRNRHGASPSPSALSSLIHRFVARGEMEKAVEVLEMMTMTTSEDVNFVSSAVVSRFCRIGKPELALGFFETAVKSEALSPSVVTYTTIVTALCQLGRVDEVRGLVRRLEEEEEEDGFEFDCVFYSNWIHGYLKGGALMDALIQDREMVEKGINRDVVSYSILIDWFSKEGRFEKAFGLLGKMMKEGIEPSLITFTAIMRGLCKRGRLEEAFRLFDRVLSMGMDVDEFVYVTLIDGVCRKGDLNRAFALLGDMEERGVKPSVLTYNAVINGLCRAGRVSEADEISKGVLGDVVTYSTLLDSYIKEENVDAVLEVRRRFVEAGIPMDLVMCNILLKAFLLIGAYGEAHVLYGAMPEMELTPDAVTYTTMIEGCCKTGQIEEALEVFDELRKSSVSSSAVCYNRIICALCKNEMFETATEVLTEMCDKGLYLDINTSHTLLHSVHASGGEKGILCLVSRLEQLNSSMIFNDAILLLCKSGSFDAAIEVYMVMRRKGLSVTCLSTFLKALVDNHRALDAYSLVENTLLSMDVIDYTIIVNGLCKEGFMTKALYLCTVAKQRGIILNIITYNSLINGLCQQGCLVEALRLFDSLEKIGLVPSQVSYGILIDSLCKEGLFLDAEKFLDTMVCKGLVPNILIYNSMIDGYCKLGRTEDAVNVLTRKMMGRVTPDAFTVSSLIKGYSKRGDMEEALRVFAEFKGKNISADFLGFLYLIKGLCTKGRMEEARSVLREMLVSEPVIGLINRVDAELVESESVRGFLVELCEQGRVSQAVKILDEISSTFYLSGKKNSGSYQRLKLLNGVGEKEVEKEGFVNDFHSLHSTVSSLCYTGELKQANEFVMSVLSCMPK